MFETDIKRIKACIEHEDYFNALEYAILAKDNYLEKEKKFFQDMIKNIKTGKYIKNRAKL